MTKPWPKVKLGEVLRRVERFEPRDELTEYPFAGTYSFARGIFVGERKLGSTFALPKIQRIRAGDFTYCKIMAWEGEFGIAHKHNVHHLLLRTDRPQRPLLLHQIQYHHPKTIPATCPRNEIRKP